jgi:hypothetical protein
MGFQKGTATNKLHQKHLPPDHVVILLGMVLMCKISDLCEKGLTEEKTGSEILPRTTHVAQSGPCYGYSDGQEDLRR